MSLPHGGCSYVECKICFPRGILDYPLSWMTPEMKAEYYRIKVQEYLAQKGGSSEKLVSDS